MNNETSTEAEAAERPQRDPGAFGRELVPGRLPDLCGQIVAGRYQLTRKLGAGGMGEVYEARHLTLGRPLAIKLLRQECASHQRHLERFEREAKALASLNSHYIVQVTDFGVTDAGLPFMAMEYLEGEDLRQRLMREGALSVNETITLVLDACEGVGDAHAEGFVHRDLKPENLFITRGRAGREHCKILDFGVAKLRDSRTFTRDGALVGTVQYMAPEQASGTKDLDGRVDIFALGAILFECLSGSAAFTGDKSEVILFKILHEGPPRLGSLNRRIPPELEQIVHRALSREPDARYSTVAELASALSRVGGGPRSLTLSELSTGPAGKPSDSNIDGGSAPRESSSLASRPARHWLVVAAAALSITGAAVALGTSVRESADSADGAARSVSSPMAVSPPRAKRALPATVAEPPPANEAPPPNVRIRQSGEESRGGSRRPRAVASPQPVPAPTASSPPASQASVSFDLDPNPYK